MGVPAAASIGAGRAGARSQRSRGALPAHAEADDGELPSQRAAPSWLAAGGAWFGAELGSQDEQEFAKLRALSVGVAGEELVLGVTLRLCRAGELLIAG